MTTAVAPRPRHRPRRDDRSTVIEHHVSVRVTAPQRERLDALAAERGVSVSAVAREAIAAATIDRQVLDDGTVLDTWIETDALDALAAERGIPTGQLLAEFLAALAAQQGCTPGELVRRTFTAAPKT
jgi:predicted transcriptional regulator